jgi:hypothetical protein
MGPHFLKGVKRQTTSESDMPNAGLSITFLTLTGIELGHGYVIGYWAGYEAGRRDAHREGSREL